MAARSLPQDTRRMRRARGWRDWYVPHRKPGPVGHARRVGAGTGDVRAGLPLVPWSKERKAALGVPDDDARRAAARQTGAGPGIQVRDRYEVPRRQISDSGATLWDDVFQGNSHRPVVGDLASSTDAHGNPLPGLAQVAMQGGAYAAKAILRKVKGPPELRPSFVLVQELRITAPSARHELSWRRRGKLRRRWVRSASGGSRFGERLRVFCTFDCGHGFGCREDGVREGSARD